MAVNADHNAALVARGAGTDRVNNTAQGWGIAGLVILLAIISNAFIYVVHKKTFKAPTDPTNVTAPARPPARPRARTRDSPTSSSRPGHGGRGSSG